MSIHRSDSPPNELGDEARLEQLLRRELQSIPIEHWGFFFPLHVGVWRFIEEKRPGVLGSLDAGFRGEPYFKGKGADWFCHVLGNDPRYIELLESILYPLVHELGPKLPGMDFVPEDQLPPLVGTEVSELARVVLAAVDNAGPPAGGA